MIIVKKLVINNEQLMCDWDWVKNQEEGLDPNTLTCGSNKTAHWKCHICGHEWTTRIERKNRGAMCRIREVTVPSRQLLSVCLFFFSLFGFLF